MVETPESREFTTKVHIHALTVSYVRAGEDMVAELGKEEMVTSSSRTRGDLNLIVMHFIL